MKKKKVVKEKEKKWWQILFCKIFGLLFILAPLFIYISLAGYNANDPSFNKAISEVQNVKNYLGLPGAIAADVVLSTFGLSLMIFLIVPFFWGMGLLRYHAFGEYKTRIFAWIVGMLSFAVFLDLSCHAYLGSFGLPYNLAGEWSRVLSRPLNSYINVLNTPYNTLILESIILFVGVLSFNFAAGITFKFWFKCLQKIKNLVLGIFGLLTGIGKRIARIPNFKEFKELKPRYLQNKLQESAKQKQEPTFGASVNAVEQLRNKETTGVSSVSKLQIATAKSQSFAAKNSALTIEMPKSCQNAGNSDVTIEVPKVSSVYQQKVDTYSPTFDFIDDTEAANQNKKKMSPKMSANEIYATENSKAAIKKSLAQSIAVQTELLDVPSSGDEKALLQKEPQSQITSGTQAKVEMVQVNKRIEEPVKKDEYILPSIELMTPRQNSEIVVDENVLKENAAQLEQALKDFGIKGQIVKVRPGPVVTLYELEPAPGIRTARVIGLADDIARSMAAVSVRMAVVSGQKTIGIELPNTNRQTVWLRELFENEKFQTSKNILNVALGKDIGGQYVYADLAGMPHLLVAGTTGSGKSVGVNSMILSLLYRLTPEQCKFIMIDPKCVEFSMYNGIPHLLTPVITDPAKAVVGLKWAVQEMESRNRALALLNVRNITGYNKKIEEMRKTGKGLTKTIQTGFDKETGRPIYEEQTIDTSPMPYIVIVVDEMADLMLVAGKEVEAAIQRLAQMGRAVGIHLIMATQRPSVDVITGVIKANFPSRISFHVTNKFDSTTIIGEKGAEQLLGRGDMLFMASGDRPRRVHGCFIEDAEVEKIVEYIKSQGEPQYKAEVTAGELNAKDNGAVFDKGDMAGDAEEDLYRQAVDIVRTDKKASTSYIQRKLRIGYNRAANLIERMEQEGIISHPDHVGRREILG